MGTMMFEAVNAEEQHEMADICEEKLQLSECLDRMSTEIINLHNSIANKDKQNADPHLALDDGAGLEDVRDEIEHGRRRAEDLETKIGALQVPKLLKQAAKTTSTSSVQVT